MENTQDRVKYPHPWRCDPVDAFPKNVTPEGVRRMADYVGDWVSDFYGVRYLTDDRVDPKGPTEEQLPVDSGSRLVADYPQPDRVLRRTPSSARATQRQPATEV